MGRTVEVCGQCMQGIDKNGRGHARHCGGNAGNLSSTGQMLTDRGPAAGKSSAADDATWQRHKEREAARFARIAARHPERTAKRAIGKRVSEGFSYDDAGNLTHPDAVEGTKLAKGFLGGYKIVKDEDSGLWNGKGKKGKR